MLLHQAHRLGDRLDGADLVIDQHHRQDGTSVRVAIPTIQQGLQRLDVGDTVGGDRNIHHGEATGRCGRRHGFMLDCGMQDRAGLTGLDGAMQREIERFGAATGEDHVFRPRTQGLADPAARGFHPALRRLPVPVNGGRIAGFAHDLGHQLDHGRSHRRGRVMIQIDPHLSYSAACVSAPALPGLRFRAPVAAPRSRRSSTSSSVMEERKR